MKFFGKKRNSKSGRRAKSGNLLGEQRQTLNKTGGHDSPLDYYWNIVFDLNENILIRHPNREQYFRDQVGALCSKPLSTYCVEILSRLYDSTQDGVTRALLAKKIHVLRRDYLKAYKEYSDRALIRLIERKNFLDKWEGIYILGCFGSTGALEYLGELLRSEKDQLIIQTIVHATHKIKRKEEAKNRERGMPFKKISIRAGH